MIGSSTLFRHSSLTRLRQASTSIHILSDAQLSVGRCRRSLKVTVNEDAIYGRRTGGRSFSSNNLLGYSPMAGGGGGVGQHSNIPIGIDAMDSSRLIPTVQETVIAGVWQSSTAKRDKLLELKVELATIPSTSKSDSQQQRPLIPKSLDQLATDRQKLDLWFVDGLKLIVNNNSINPQTQPRTTTNSPLQHHFDRIQKAIRQQIIASSAATGNAAVAAVVDKNDDVDDERSVRLNRKQWEKCLDAIYKDLYQLLQQQQQETLPSPQECFGSIRDFVDATEYAKQFPDLLPIKFLENKESSESSSLVSPSTLDTGNSSRSSSTTTDHLASILANDLSTTTATQFSHASVRWRVQSTMAIVQQLRQSWSILTAVTDQDTDRAAVRPTLESTTTATSTTASSNSTTDFAVSAALTDTPVAPSLPSNKLMAVLLAFLGGSGTEQFDALWHLMDKDDDGLLDEVEMDHVCSIMVQSTQAALRRQVTEALDAAPLDKLADAVDSNNDTTAATANAVTKLSWMERRRAKQDKSFLTKLLNKTLKTHFEDELEMPNRLRCIYAWANKTHQDNKLDSVLVTESGGGIVTSISGRKRYVELHPKIALDEFREVQAIHFPQLDNVASEFLTSFRDELHVQQGKGRQNRELMRDCAGFFVTLCIMDYVILSL